MNTARVPMMFPGQASQLVGMARDLSVDSGAGGRYLQGINDALGLDLLGIMENGPAEVLTETRNAQPAILAHSVATFLTLRERGVEPVAVAGHSLGEYSAAVACGAMDPFDALRVVRKRGELMFDSGKSRPGTMAAVMGLDASCVREVCLQVDGEVVLANLNSPNQMVISGSIEAVQAAQDALQEAGARRVIPLNVSGAFHSPLLAEAAEEFKRFLADIELRDPQVPLIANVHAGPVNTAHELREGLEAQLVSPVLWHPSLEELCKTVSSGSTVLEVGPGKVLTNLAKRSLPGLAFFSVGTLEDLDQLAIPFRAMEGKA